MGDLPGGRGERRERSGHGERRWNVRAQNGETVETEEEEKEGLRERDGREKREGKEELRGKT